MISTDIMGDVSETAMDFPEDFPEDVPEDGKPRKEKASENVPPPPCISSITQAMASLEIFTSEMRQKHADAFPAKSVPRTYRKPKVPKYEESLEKIVIQEKELEHAYSRSETKPSRPPKIPKRLKVERPAVVISEAQSQAALRVRELKRRIEETTTKRAKECEEERENREKETQAKVQYFQELTKERVVERQALLREKPKEKFIDPELIESRRRESARRVAVRKKLEFEKLSEKAQMQEVARREKEKENEQKALELQRRTKTRVQNRVEKIKRQQEAEAEAANEREREQKQECKIEWKR